MEQPCKLPPDEFYREIDNKCGKSNLRGEVIMKHEVPIWEKSNLNLEEATGYFNIGINKLRELTDSENCPFVFWCGNKRLIKRKALDEYLKNTYSI